MKVKLFLMMFLIVIIGGCESATSKEIKYLNELSLSRDSIVHESIPENEFKKTNEYQNLDPKEKIRILNIVLEKNKEKIVQLEIIQQKADSVFRNHKK